MTRFETLTGVAAPFPDSDVDTDVIFPARFLLLLDKAGLGRHLFNERRYDKSGAPRPDFMLNQHPFDKACILVAGPRFGSGSSREQAVWALADFGVRCVIAPSFGEIFFSNCFKNGVLPVRLSVEDHGDVMDAAKAMQSVTVDLFAKTVSVGDRAFDFEIDDYRRRSLLEGLDEIGLTLHDDAADIAAFETRRRADAPWIELGDRARRMADPTGTDR